MLGSEILDVAIGLALVFLLLSLLSSAIREGVEAWFKTRAVYLERGIFELLRRDRGLVETVYNHPMIAGLFRGDYVATEVTGRRFYNRTNLPSYIPAAEFAQALLDIAARGRPGSAAHISVDGAAGGQARITADNVRSTIQNLGQPGVQRVLLSALDRANGDINQAQVNIEAWFNGAMDRVSGWYKRRTQIYLLVFGAILAVAMNADTIKIARFLYRDESARAALVGMADAAIRDTSIQRAVDARRGDQAGTGSSGGITQEELLERIDRLQLPIGWGEHAPKGRWQFLLGVVGWLMTAVGVSLGAPFWFDLLNKFMVIRSTVKPHEKSPEEASEDRQTRAERAALNVVTVRPPAGGAPGGGGGGVPGGGGAGGVAAAAVAVPTDKELLAALPTTPAIEVQP